MTRPKRPNPAHLADDTRPVNAPTRSGCRCRNHKGTPKQQHRTREAAVDAIVTIHLRHGGAYEVYQCPRSDRWHVRTMRKDNA